MYKKKKKIMFVCGSQNLYDFSNRKKVEKQTKTIINHLNEEIDKSCEIYLYGVLTDEISIYNSIKKINYDEDCIGVIFWMHTFSPAKMWVKGLLELQKPMLHLHTQYNDEIPWDTIDMDYMNLNQSAHGDKEFGYLLTKLNKKRKVIVGYWKTSRVHDELNKWIKFIQVMNCTSNMKIASFGSSMRNVAVTDGYKLDSLIQLGWTVEDYSVGYLLDYIKNITRGEIDELFEEYCEKYTLSVENDSMYIDVIKQQARIELGMERFLKEKGFSAFTTNVEDIYGLAQLPGLAVQRLMEKGYGFGAEGDWRTAGLLKILKLFGDEKASSFIEDYTYNLVEDNELVLGSHMLEVCPTISKDRPQIIVSKLDIGGKGLTARMKFDAKPGNAYLISLVELYGKYRLIVSEIEVVDVSVYTPELPVAKAIWKPKPNFYSATEAWLYVGGSHHNILTYNTDLDMLREFAYTYNIELIIIDNNLNINEFRERYS